MSGVLKRQSILPRLDGISRDIERLRKFGEQPFEEFKTNDDNFSLAKFHLRQALEGVFHIGEHILSRINGGRATEYKEIAKKLGEYKVVDPEFAQTKLAQMAGYRNRLTHFYSDIAHEEMYQIIKNDLGDIETFTRSIKELLENPKKFNLEIE